MASTIKNLYEVTGRPVLRERTTQFKKGITGLGPDDLVVLDKKEKGFLHAAVVNMFYHHVTGVRHSPASFPSYYADLLRRQESGSRFPGSKKVSIVKGRLYCFNSFRQEEIRITVKQPPQYEVARIKRDGTEEVLDQVDWNELRIASELRFYRGGQPLLYSLFGNRMQKSYALLNYRIDPMMSQDLEYVMQNHPLDDEVASALAAGLLISFESREVLAFLEKYGKRLPSIYGHMLRFLPVDCVFTGKLKPVAEDVWMRFCDDTDLALRLIDYQIATGGDLGRYVPLLKGSMWSNPMAALCLARIAIAKGKYEKGFNLINASAHCLNWPSAVADPYQPMLTKPKTALPYKSQQEGRITGAPFVGMNAASFYVTAQLIDRITVDEFTNQFLKKMTDQRKTSGAISSFALWPPPNHPFANEDDEDQCLYDPGIDDDEHADMKVLEKLPFSLSFSTLIKDVVKALQRKRDILMNIEPAKREVPKEDATSVTILGLRLRSKELVLKGFSMARSDTRQATSLLRLLLLKAQIDGLGPDLDEIFSLELSELTVSDSNALGFVEDLAVAIDRGA